MVIVNWNVEWATASSPRGKLLRERIWGQEPDVVCLTEGYTDFFPPGGYLATASGDYGYRGDERRRKVLLWSREPWLGVCGDEGVENGRYLRATTQTPIGSITFIGVCIPWKDAHVRTGQRNRQPWEDHHRFLRGLDALFARLPLTQTVMLGDYNQQIPRRRAPLVTWQLLENCLRGRFVVATGGKIEPEAKQTIDHIAHTPDLKTRRVYSLSNFSEAGKRLSDHFGIVAELE